jgi:hypothetical protein
MLVDDFSSSWPEFNEGVEASNYGHILSGYMVQPMSIIWIYMDI